MPQAFAPGCALMLHKPESAQRLLAHLQGGEPVPMHLTCCRNEPNLAAGTQVINVCSGCHRRFRELYEGLSAISLWEVLADSDFPFPDYGGAEMAIHDACPTRNQPQVHVAVRALLARMNITLVEPRNTGAGATCCGDSFHGLIPDAELRAVMAKRAAEMPREDVVVYCVSCVKSMHNGGKRPRHLVDLLFGEDTPTGVSEPDAWHAQLREFIQAH